MVVLAGILLAKGQTIQGLVGVALFAVAVIVCFLASPWRNPDTPYWKLMLAMYCTPGVAIAWAIWVLGMQESGLNPMISLTLLYAVLFPMWQIGRRRWSDSEPPEPAQPVPSKPSEKHT